MIYKQDFYNNKEKEIDDLFSEYLVPVMDDLDHPVLIEEWKKILILLIMKTIHTKMHSYHQLRNIYHNDKTEYWPTSIKESIDWSLFYII